eukprot:3941982-Rhodomonas_salina.1
MRVPQVCTRFEIETAPVRRAWDPGLGAGGAPRGSCRPVHVRVIAGQYRAARRPIAAFAMAVLYV